ncbi:MAG: hypothetical protein A2Y20_00755 [Firmicutes bacterium GWF2_51_9]|nr:MAG: hypothetical protein A2Y20_00755 [Firmicutes bacterium GWF2_51_9]OGS58323.1 MAG: hypothetical protein A2Y19_08405 [Firmicutes bacterium GWE2_51_13]
MKKLRNLLQISLVLFLMAGCTSADFNAFMYGKPSAILLGEEMDSDTKSGPSVLSAGEDTETSSTKPANDTTDTVSSSTKPVGSTEDTVTSSTKPKGGTYDDDDASDSFKGWFRGITAGGILVELAATFSTGVDTVTSATGKTTTVTSGEVTTFPLSPTVWIKIDDKISALLVGNLNVGDWIEITLRDGVVVGIQLENDQDEDDDEDDEDEDDDDDDEDDDEDEDDEDEDEDEDEDDEEDDD